MTALLVLDPDIAAVWAGTRGKGHLGLAELAADPEVLAEVQAGVDEANRQFARSSTSSSSRSSATSGCPTATC